MNIRNATAADAAALVRIWNPWITDTAITFNPEAKTEAEVVAMIESRQAAGHCFLLAEEEGKIFGFATYSQFRGGPGYAHSMEHTVILSPDAHGRGIGRDLMTALEDHARQAGHRLMVAAVSAENPKARAFHQAIGYQMMGTLPEAGFKFGRHMDLWLLGKLL